MKAKLLALVWALALTLFAGQAHALPYLDIYGTDQRFEVGSDTFTWTFDLDNDVLAIGDISPISTIFSALLGRGSRYAAVMGALLDLAGEQARAVELPAEPPLDESWAEPPAFDGCSTQGQARPGDPQPIRIVRKPGNASQGASS